MVRVCRRSAWKTQRPALGIGLVWAALLVIGAAAVASGQRMNESFEETAQGSAAAGLPTTTGINPPAFVPNVPSSPSRPTGWPTGPTTNELEKHVLSSIRARPGEPLDEIALTAATADEEGQVIQTQHLAVASGPRPEAQSLAAAMVVARVGPEVVLEADLLTPKALEWLAQVSPGLPPEKVRELRLQICQQVMPSHIETLLVYVDACREIPGEKLPEIRENVDKAFDEQQLPRMMESEGVANSLEFEQRLRSQGM